MNVVHIGEHEVVGKTRTIEFDGLFLKELRNGEPQVHLASRELTRTRFHPETGWYVTTPSSQVFFRPDEYSLEDLRPLHDALVAKLASRR